MSKKVKTSAAAPLAQHELPEHEPVKQEEAKAPEVKHEKHEKSGKAEMAMDVDPHEMDPSELIHRAFATLHSQPVH